MTRFIILAFLLSAFTFVSSVGGLLFLEAAIKNKQFAKVLRIAGTWSARLMVALAVTIVVIGLLV